MDEWMDGGWDSQIDRQGGRQTDRHRQVDNGQVRQARRQVEAVGQSDRQIDRQTDRQVNKQTMDFIK